MNSLRSYQPCLTFGDFSDVYLEESQNLTLQWEEGRVESIVAAEPSGVGYRLIKGTETRFGFLDGAHPLTAPIQNRLDPLVQGLTAGLPTAGPPSLKEPVHKIHPISKDPSRVSLKEKMALLKRAYDAAQKNPLIRQVRITYGEKIKKIGYANSEGHTFLEDRVYTVFAVMVTAEKDGDLQNAYEAMGGITGFELFDDGRAEAMASLVADRALLKLEAPQAPVGEMPIVVAACAGGTLIHEAVGHSLEADAVLEGTSPSYKGKVGQVVAHEKLTVFDDPTVATKRGSFYFDDEGVPSESSKLIENGVLKDYMFDRLSAKRAGRPSNGHGRRESYAHRPIPRMSNTFIAPGPDDPQKILTSLQNGLLVTRMGGGQVNTANGDFVFDVEEGFQIKDGQKTLVRGATLLGNGPEVLRNIDLVGSDHGWGLGTCGKEGQGVPVSDAIPTIRIKKLVVGGQ